MNTTRMLIAASLLLAIAPAAASAQSSRSDKVPPKKLYCWDEGGRKVCGDALPADAVDSARTEISINSGMTTARFNRTLTAAERVEAERAARAQALAEAREAARERREIAMAESYATEEDLRRAYQNRIELLDETVKGSALGVEGLRRSLVQLLRQAGERELNGQAVGKALADNIHGQHQELLRQQDMLGEQQRERMEIESELQAALQRYRELKNTGGDTRG